MRLMRDEEMLEICDAGAEARAGLARQMAPLYGGKPNAWLGDSVAKGRSQVREVRRGGAIIAVYWCYLSRLNNTLVVNAAGSLVKEDIHEDLFAACEHEARQRGAKAIQFQTARRGLVKRAQDRGYVPEGIVLSKLL